MAIDIASEAYGLRLQIRDVTNLMKLSRKTPEDDENVAFKLLRRESLTALYANFDRQKALHLAKADVASQLTITNTAEEERQAARDRELALRLGEEEVEQDQVPAIQGIQREAAATIETVQQGQIEQLQDDSNVVPLRVASAGENETLINQLEVADMSTSITDLACSSCGDVKPEFDVWNLSCEHAFCRICLTRMFSNSVKFMGHFPPRCCKTDISLDDVKDYYFDKVFVDMIRKKHEELTTEKPLYCSNPRCSEFLPPRLVVDSNTTCPVCQTKTCNECRDTAHEGACQPNTMQDVLEVAKDQGWQRCNHCNMMVELTVGCNHITYVPQQFPMLLSILVTYLLTMRRCTCGAEFCYECGIKWKQCPCATWCEERLFSAAHRRAARDGHGVAPNAQAIQAAAADIQANHECNHEEGWIRRFRRDGHDTECEMGCRNPEEGLAYIMECEGCGIRACRICISRGL
jgi:hypothetical protein